MKIGALICRRLVVLAVVCVAASALADLVKLKDGAVLDGTILAEDDKHITVEVELAQGSITKQEMVDKSNVVEIVRLTPEQKAERQMVRDYEKAKRYQLDPASSYPLATYDQVISSVFRKFLTQYTNSPHQQEIAVTITQWEAEREIVASGQAKYHGKWLAAAEAAKLVEQDRAKRLLQQGQGMLSKHRYDEAIKQFHALSQTGKDPQLVAEAHRLEAESYQRWLESLDREQQRINEEIQSSEERAAKAQSAKENAQANSAKASGSNVRRMGVDGFSFEAARAESEAKIAQNQAEQLRKELASVQQLASDLRTRAAGAAAGPGPTALTAAQATSPQTAEQHATAANDGTAMLNGVVDWIKQKWIFIAGGLLIGLWLIARLFTRS
jgi:hypothetical protein